jgi:hypothetical protein
MDQRQKQETLNINLFDTGSPKFEPTVLEYTVFDGYLIHIYQTYKWRNEEEFYKEITNCIFLNCEIHFHHPSLKYTIRFKRNFIFNCSFGNTEFTINQIYKMKQMNFFRDTELPMFVKTINEGR